MAEPERSISFLIVLGVGGVCLMHCTLPYFCFASL
jgi:hypothetical protein